MSAFMVTDKHIRYMVNAALSRKIVGNYALTWTHLTTPRSIERGDYKAATELGEMLLNENRKSVGYRYSTIEPAPNYEHKIHPDTDHPIDPVWVLKITHCYEYQACEHEGWKTSDARAFCQALKERAIRALDGYEAAPWGI